MSDTERVQIGVGCVDITDREKRYVADVLETGRLSYGPYLKKFETDFARAHDCAYAITVNSGTSALEMAVACLKETGNWKDGDEVICPAITFVATANVVLQNNLEPVFVDIDSRTYNIDPAKIEAAITSKTRAIMVVHLFGQPADMGPIMEIARTHNLRVIEDSCETMFARYRGKSVGSFGDISCFSTYAAHLIVTGVGGLALTNSPEYAEILRSLANHGRDNIYISIDDDKTTDKERKKEIISRRYNFIRRGYSYRLTEMEGALGLGQLERRDEIIGPRRINAAYLIENLKQFEKYLQLPWRPEHSEHSFMMFPIVIREDSPVKKTDLVNFLEERGIETRDMLPIINQPFYIEKYGDLESRFPVAHWINRSGFYVGCHQKISQEQLGHMVSAFAEFFSAQGLAR